MPTIVDSSGWIEYFVGGPNADRFSEAIERTEDLIVPAITLTEVYRWMLREATESDALTAVITFMERRL